MKGIIAGVVLLVFAVMKYLSIQRVRAAERQGGCVSCGSVNTEWAGEAIACRDCGYEGRADRGGRLSEEEIGSIYDRRDGGR